MELSQQSQTELLELNSTINTPLNLTVPITTEITDTVPTQTSTNNIVLEAYEHVVEWRKNLFALPSGKIGNMFIQEMTQNINNWCADKDRNKSLYKIMIMPSLLLQKT